MQKIIVRTSSRRKEFKVVSADLYLNWLIPYFRNHKYVTNLVFNRSFETYDISIEFDVLNGTSFEYLRFANDLMYNFCSENNCYIDCLTFNAQ